jgi:glycosyltransferase involved in cell wall biosynthesis
MLNALAQSDPSWALALIGDGRERRKLAEQAADLGIEDRIVWHGAIANAGALMPAFDAFVLSSRTEGTPIALFEAMHARVPVIATQVGGVPDVVTSEHAVVVLAERPAMIAAALAELKRDPASAKRRSDHAYERLLQAFSAQAWVDSIEKVYRTVCA